MEINLITFEQAKQIDEKTIQKGIEEKILMGLASQSACITLQHLNFIHRDYHYIFLCGSGNNGGDGLALAYLLLSTTIVKPEQIFIYLKDSPKSHASQFYYELLKQNDIAIYPLEEFLQKDINLDKKNLIFEGLLGTGQRDLPRSPYKEILLRIKDIKNRNIQSVLHIALDLPAGLSEVYSEDNEESYINFFGLPIPDYILNFGLKKLALIHPLIQSYSKIYVLPCGFDPQVQNQVIKEQPKFKLWKYINDDELFRKKAFEHKYQSGYAWLFASSRNMEGAGILSAKSFFYSGGGILHFIHFSDNRKDFLQIEPSIIYHHIDEWKNHYKSVKLPRSIVMGPGLSKNDIETHKKNIFDFFHYLVSVNHYPILILDAYATKLVKEKDFPEKLKPFTIITPHLGEWKQLSGAFPFITSNWNKIFKLHEELGVSILLKSSISFFLPSIYFLENNMPVVYIWKYQNPHLSVAGSGDVLTGLISSYFSKNNEYNLSNLVRGMNLILSLQFKIAKQHSTAYDQLTTLKNLF